MANTTAFYFVAGFDVNENIQINEQRRTITRQELSDELAAWNIIVPNDPHNVATRRLHALYLYTVYWIVASKDNIWKRDLKIYKRININEIN